MSREKKLVKNTIILTLGKIFTQLITFILLPLYTTLLSTDEYGVVDLLNTLVSLLLPIVGMQIEQAVFRNLIDCRDNEEKKKSIISTSLFCVFTHMVIYILLCLIIFPFIKNQYKIFIATNVIVYVYSSFLQQVARGFGNNTSFAKGSFIIGLFTIVLNIVFLVFCKMQAIGMLLGTMLGQIVGIIYFCFVLKVFKYIKIKSISKELMRSIYKYSIPLVPNAISWWIFNASDRVIVSLILGVSQNGILSASHKFSSVYVSVYSIFNMSWTEMISEHINDNDIESFFNRMLNIVLRLFIVAALGIIVCMPIVYPLMIDNSYFEGYYQVPIMMIGSIFNIIIGLISAIYVAKKDTKSIANTSIMAGIINVVIHLLLINKMRLYAATISTLVAYMIMSLYRINDINKKYFKIKIDLEIIVKSILILIISLPVYYSKNFVLQMIILLITVIYALDLNKNILMIAIEIFTKKYSFTLNNKNK